MGGFVTNDGGGSTFSPAPAGTHKARCYYLVDLGVQPSNNTQFASKPTVVIGFELVETFKEDGEPYMVSRWYNNTLNNSYLRRDLEGWRGKTFTDDELKGFDLRKIVGKPCIVSITHNKKKTGDVRADITSISAPLSGMDIADCKNELLMYSVNMHLNTSGDSSPDEIEVQKQVFEKLSEKMQERVKLSNEWTNYHSPTRVPEEDFDDDIPGFEEDEDLPF